MARLVAGCWLLLAAPVAGDEPPRPPGFGEVIDVRVVNLEVVVTRRGERVGGLGASDFALRVDGDDVPIEYFTEVLASRARAAPRSEPGTFPALVAGEPVGTRYLLFIDDDFAIPALRNRALTELAGQLSLLGARDRMAVVAFDGRRLDLLSSWTRSLARLSTALAAAQQRRAYGMLRRSELRNAATGAGASRRLPGSSFSGTGFTGLGRALTPRDPAVLRYSDAHGKVSRVVRAATSALRGFAGPPGRKVMLLLAGGWPAYGRSGDRDIFDRLESARRLFTPLVDTANRLGFTLYPVDLQGGTYDTRAAGAEYGTFTQRHAGAAAEQERERLSEDALYYLAEQTGGRAILGGARLTALERTIEDTRSYYWLGFTPSWQGDGGQHQIEVEALPGGLKARTRRSFADLSRQDQVSMWIESAHLFGAPLPGSVELAVEIGEARPQGAGRIVLPLSLEVPFERVTVLPRDGSFAASLELRVAATDSDGASAGIEVSEVEIVSQRPPAPGQTVAYEASLELRRKPHRLLISLYDPPTGTVLVKRIDFEP